MLQLLPNKKSVRHFLRRYVLRIPPEKNQLRCLRDCLEKPKPGHSKIWLVLIIPVVYTSSILAGKNIITSGPVKLTNIVGALRTNGSLIGPRHLGKQLAAPRVTLKDDVDGSLEEHWLEQDLELRTFLLKIKMLQNEHRNIFTPRSAFEFTEVPITTTAKISAKDNLPVCKWNHNQTVKDSITLNLSPYNASLEDLYPMIDQGGHFRPADCWARHKVAILVPYRKRLDNLVTFLINIHPFLMAQKLEYRIFVVEQLGNNRFNKGRLLNAGFKVMKKLGDWPCVILHDVDLLPLDPRIMYSCSTYPRLMSSALYFTNASYNESIPGTSSKQTSFRLTQTKSADLSDSGLRRFGGVAAITLQQYERVNGHSNLYRGWGNEDADMYIRLRTAGLRVTTNNKNISRYVQLPHAKEFNQDINWTLLLTAKHRFQHEGLSTLDYQVLNVTYHHLFTHILVVLEERPLRNTFNKISYDLPMYPSRFNKYKSFSILKRPKLT